MKRKKMKSPKIKECDCVAKCTKKVGLADDVKAAWNKCV